MIEEAIFQYGQQGFGYLVAVFLLWKGYKQDERYIRVLERLEARLDKHTEEKDRALTLLEKSLDKATS